MSFVYTIGIKRRFLPGFKKYKVTGHKTQFELNGYQLATPRLVLSLVDGSEMAIADILHRDHIVFLDFKEERAKYEMRQAEILADKKYQEDIQEEKRLYQEFLKSRHEPVNVVPIPAKQQA